MFFAIVLCIDRTSYIFLYANAFHLIPLLVCRLLLLLFHNMICLAQVKTNIRFKHSKSLFPVLYKLT